MPNCQCRDKPLDEPPGRWIEPLMTGSFGVRHYLPRSKLKVRVRMLHRLLVRAYYPYCIRVPRSNQIQSHPSYSVFPNDFSLSWQQEEQQFKGLA